MGAGDFAGLRCDQLDLTFITQWARPLARCIAWYRLELQLPYDADEATAHCCSCNNPHRFPCAARLSRS